MNLTKLNDKNFISHFWQHIFKLVFEFFNKWVWYSIFKYNIWKQQQSLIKYNRWSDQAQYLRILAAKSDNIFSNFKFKTLTPKSDKSFLKSSRVWQNWVWGWFSAAKSDKIFSMVKFKILAAEFDKEFVNSIFENFSNQV